MNNEIKTPEEKAREYTDDVIGNYHYVGWDKEEAIIELNNAYLACYHSHDEEIKELRDALKEIIQECEDYVIKQANISNQGIPCYVSIDDLEYHIEQAKQLLKLEAL